MARSKALKRQKQKARKEAKRKQKRKAMSRQKPRSLADQMTRAAGAPVRHCSVSTTFWDEGLGSLLVSRDLDDGMVAFAVFLVDRYCLGVKDVFARVEPLGAYQEFYESYAERYEMVDLRPECARKLVEGAVAFARDFGLRPHRDYRKAAPIFQDFDAGACPEEFEYGRKGRPFFIAGPYDSPAFCQKVLTALENHGESQSFDSMIPLVPGLSVMNFGLDVDVELEELDDLEEFEE